MTYPDPNNPNPTTRNGADLGETPVSVGGNDGRDKLGNAEGCEQGDRGTFHEEESMGASDEDERLGYNRNLEIDDHVEHAVVGGWYTWKVLEVDTELVLEEVRLQDDNDEDDG